MATAISDSIITIDDSVARGFAVHELVISNWGLFTPGSDPIAVYPDFTLRGLPAVSGMMIGPKSQVDRVWVVPDMLANGTVVGPFGNLVPAYDFTRVCSIKNPIFFPVQGNRTVGAPPAITSLRLLSSRYSWNTPPNAVPPYIDDDTTNVPATYIKAGETSAIDFPPYAAGVGLSGQGPLLQLLLFIAPPTSLVSLPTKRAPLVGHTWSVVGSGSAEVYAVAIPTYGRKSGFIQYVTTQTLDVAARVGGLQPACLTGGGALDGIPVETTVASDASITSSTAYRVAVSVEGYDYVILYYTRNSGSGELRVRWMFTDE